MIVPSIVSGGTRHLPGNEIMMFGELIVIGKRFQRNLEKEKGKKKKKKKKKAEKLKSPTQRSKGPPQLIKTILSACSEQTCLQLPKTRRERKRTRK
jgi:hypothetical protein